MAFQNPKGTEDFYPEDKSVQDYVFNRLRQVCDRFNFKEVESPAIESLDLLTKKSGSEITQQIFTLDQRGNEKLGLRFELTAPIVRMFIEKQKSMPKPVKWFGLSRMWRYERPQKGRQREFYQLSVELFGSKSVYADAEIINLLISCLKEFGLTKKDFVVKISNRFLLEALCKDFKVNFEALVSVIDKKSKLPMETFVYELEKIGLSKIDIKKLDKILSAKQLSKLKVKCEAYDNLVELFSLLDTDFIEFDLSIVRGLAYYTGTVFECYDREGQFRAIAGGGRYDDLVKLFGGLDTEAIGFGLGYSTLSLLLKEKQLLPKLYLGPDYYIACVSDNVRSNALSLVDYFRSEGYSVEYDLCNRNYQNQIKYMEKINASKLIIVGENEVKSGSLIVKSLKNKKEEKMNFTF